MTTEYRRDTCVAALLSRAVSAVVLDIGNESARVKACK